jgi:protoporphyrinogen oxidase
MKDKVRYLIIGAGPTGLGAAYRLKELGIDDFLVLEKNEHAGGLAASFVDAKGFTWDVGGHVIFSHYKRFDNLLKKAIRKDEWLKHEREAWAWLRDRWVPYPVQSNIRRLPEDTMWQCLDGLIAASRTPPAKRQANFQDWVIATFGPGLAEVFFLPYNAKVWAYPPQMLSHQWISDRVARSEIATLVRNIVFGIDDISWGPNRTFMFPRHGGTGQVWSNTARIIGEDRIRFGSEVTRIDHSRKTVTTASGDTHRYAHLLSTMPVDLLCGLLHPLASRTVLKACGELLHSSSNVVGLGLKGRPPKSLRTKCWMYFPEDNCPFYRVTVFSNYSPNNVPDNRKYWSLIAETSESRRKPVRHSRLVADTIRGCLRTGLIERENDVVSVWEHRAEHGYPIPSMGRDAALSRLLPALEGAGIQSRGRFGLWKYEIGNQDHSVMQGMEWADRMARGALERTAFPCKAQSGR